MYLNLFLIILNYISISLSAKVTWLPNTSFNLPNNFKNGKLPCSKETVIFPETLTSSIRIEADTSVGGFVLPLDGELILTEGSIGFGPARDDNCTRYGNTYYTEKSISLWAHPDVWSSSKFNKATPDAERVPCFDDIVEFPQNTDFTVVLPDNTQKVRGITLNGESFDTKTFRDYVLSQADQSQQFILNENGDTGVVVERSYCTSPAGCPCQNNALEIDCSTKFCPIPTCVNPVEPVGHCCKICGGVIAFDIDRSFDMTAFKEKVARVIDSYGGSLIYHVGRLPNKVQLVVVEKEEYTGTSAEVVNNIAYNLESHIVHQMQISGSPLYKSGLGGKIFISMFFAVALVMVAIYVYYYKLPEVRFPIMSRSQPSFFSRFDRRTESVVSLTRRDSVAPMGLSTDTAFRNPLYDSKRKYLVEESVSEE
ncbi:protein amnionless [Melitaea cinxia]|uniref:protein amnionless n=1 Tax=Melitaea cinxia TaxID=113334 RepID=UPI001E26F6C9|nr:protein amnionless [Melitaea cinxia]